MNTANDWIEWSNSVRFRRSAVASAKRTTDSGPSGYTTRVKVMLLNGETYTRHFGTIIHGAGMGKRIDVSEKEAELNAAVAPCWTRSPTSRPRSAPTNTGSLT